MTSGFLFGIAILIGVAIAIRYLGLYHLHCPKCGEQSAPVQLCSTLWCFGPPFLERFQTQKGRTMEDSRVERVTDEFPPEIFVRVERDKADGDTYLLAEYDAADALDSPNDSVVVGVYELKKVVTVTSHITLEPNS